MHLGLFIYIYIYDALIGKTVKATNFEIAFFRGNGLVNYSTIISSAWNYCFTTFNRVENRISCIILRALLQLKYGLRELICTGKVVKANSNTAS